MVGHTESWVFHIGISIELLSPQRSRIHFYQAHRKGLEDTWLKR